MTTRILRSLLTAMTLITGCTSMPAGSTESTEDDVIDLTGGHKADLVGTLPKATVTAEADTKNLRLRCGTDPNARSCSVKMVIRARAFDAHGERIEQDQLRVARIVVDGVDSSGSPILYEKDVTLGFVYEGSGTLELREAPIEFSYVAPAGIHAVRVLYVPAAGVAKVDVELSVEAREYRGNGCFVAGTPISTPDGDVPIEQLSAGQLVYSYDDLTGEVVLGDIVSTRVREGIAYGQVELSDGTHFDVSEEHPFYRAAYGDYVRAIELSEGTLVLQLQELDGTQWTDTLSVTRVDFSTEQYADVYNLDIETYDNYFARKILVHNY